jgi:hypothetical protein
MESDPIGTQRRVAARLRHATGGRMSERIERRAAQAIRQAETIRELLERADPAETGTDANLKQAIRSK